MEKRFFWALQIITVPVAKQSIYRFRTEKKRDEWVRQSHHRRHLGATDPEVRRIQRRIAAGEEVAFPVEVT